MAGSRIKSTQYQTWKQSSATYMGPPTVANLISQIICYQNEFEEEAKDIYKINTTKGLFKMCRPPQGLRNKLFFNLPDLNPNQHTEKSKVL